MINRDYKIHKNPYTGTNNRKKTKGRVKAMNRIQSIPIFIKNSKGDKIGIQGYKYINHGW